MRLLTLALIAIAAPLFAALPKPTHVEVSVSGPVPVIRWDEVEGATLYRVAVFGAPDEEGAQALLSAVWVRGLSWPYGNSKVVPKAGKLPSKIGKPLEGGSTYKVMVYAAEDDGANKSDWVSVHFTLKGNTAPAPTASPESMAPMPSATMTPTPQPPDSDAMMTATPTPAPRLDAKGATGPAELEVDLAAEFKESPEAGETGLTKTAAPATLEGARALLQKGKAEDAETAYKALLEKDATNADFWEGLGDSYDARKMKIEAKEAYEKALAIDGKRERLTKWMDENVKK